MTQYVLMNAYLFSAPQLTLEEEAVYTIFSVDRFIVTTHFSILW